MEDLFDDRDFTNRTPREDPVGCDSVMVKGKMSSVSAVRDLTPGLGSGELGFN